MSSKHLGVAVELIPSQCGITASERNVLIVLANHASPDTGLCWPSKSLISDLTGLSEATVKRAVAGLVARGFITSVQTVWRENGSQTSNRYTVDYHAMYAALSVQEERKATKRSNRNGGAHSEPPGGFTMSPHGGSPCTPQKQENNNQEINNTLSHARGAEFEAFSRKVMAFVGDDGDVRALATHSMDDLFDIAVQSPDLVFDAVQFALAYCRSKGGKLKSWTLAVDKAREYLAMYRDLNLPGGAVKSPAPVEPRPAR